MAQENIISIYKVDTENIFFDDCLFDFNLMIEKIIERGNKKNLAKRESSSDNGIETEDYKPMSIKIDDNCGFNISLYHGSRYRPNPWNHFLSKVLEGKDSNFFNKDHDFIVFVRDDLNIFCFTGGIASNLVSDICDENFPKELMIRLSNPRKIKQAKSRGLTGAFYARDLYFRGDYSISPTEAFGSVWKDICVSFRDDVKNDEEWKLIIGDSGEKQSNRKINCDVKSSFKIRKRVTFELAIKLIKKLKDEISRPLTNEEKEGFYFLDSIKIIKNKDTKNKLNHFLIEKAYNFLLDKTAQEKFDCDFCHKNYSDFLEADNYIAKRGRDELFNIDEIENAEQVLLELKSNINLKDFNEFNSDFSNKIRILSKHSDFTKDTEGSILDHLHGEIRYNNETYFLIDKEWCLIKDSFLQILSSEFSDFVKNDGMCKVPLERWSTGREGYYNELHLDKDDFLVADRIMLHGIELFDILHYDEDNLYIIQVKDGLGACTRDACSQLRNSAKLIEESVKSTDQQQIREFYNILNNTGIAYSKNDNFKKQFNDLGGEEGFVKLFLNKKRTYILAFRHGDNESDIIGSDSNIAKFEILGLKDSIRLFGSSSLKLYQIEK